MHHQNVLHTENSQTKFKPDTKNESAMDIVGIGYKIYQIYDCIRDQIDMSKNLNKIYRETENHRDNLNKTLINSQPLGVGFLLNSEL